MSRFTAPAILLLWLASMSWLIGAKVMPALRQGDPPDYQQEFAKAEVRPPPVAWDLFWNDRPVGYTISQAYSHSEQPAEIRSLVRFENLRTREVVKEFLGGASLITAAMGEMDDFKIDVTMATRLRLDWDGELDSFETAIKGGDALDLLFLRGQRTEEGRLKLSVFTGMVSGNATAPFNQELNLPSKSRIADAFSPRSQMRGLHVGQQWTTSVVSPISTMESVQLVESTVEKRETITWQGKSVEAFVVLYRHESGSGASSRGPTGTAWVLDDGLVVRQELPIGSAKIRMERTTDETAKQKAAILDGVGFDRYLQRGGHEHPIDQ